MDTPTKMFTKNLIMLLEEEHYHEVSIEGCIERLDTILGEPSIKPYCREIATLRAIINNEITNEEKAELVSRIKDKVQTEAENTFLFSSGGWGAFIGATGVGKSRAAIKVIEKLLKEKSNLSVLIVVPTEKLRDENWKEEFIRWSSVNIWDKVDRCCYASLSKISGKMYDLVILDELHNITDNSAMFFRQNEVIRCFGLTATKPKDVLKLSLLNSLGIKPIYEITPEEAIQLGLVSPYEVTIITTTLDNTDKYIHAGTKAKPFMQTEKGQYGFLSRRIYIAPSKINYLARMRFIYNLQSKTRVAQAILRDLISIYLRTLIFCGSKDQADQLCEHRYYSKPSPPKKLKEPTTEAKRAKYTTDLYKFNSTSHNYQGDFSLNAFIEGKITQLACVEALNEGMNIPDVDIGFIVQLNSNWQDLIQRIGRIIRYRPGHIGKIIILCAEDTMDKDWVKSATGKLTGIPIRVIKYSDILHGVETL